MAAQPTRRKFTVAEYYRMGESGILGCDERDELIKGEIIQMPPMGGPHASRVDRLTRELTRIPGTSAQIRVQGPLRLTEVNEPVPDVMLLRPRAVDYESAHPTANDVLLLVEVSDSTLSYDIDTKIPLYSRSGVPESWIVDVNRKVILFYLDPTPAGYRLAQTKGVGDQIAPSAFPQCEFPVEAIVR
jgi:Uma2 family endonuclease